MHPVHTAKSILDQSWLFQTPFLPPKADAGARSSALEERQALALDKVLFLTVY